MNKEDFDLIITEEEMKKLANGEKVEREDGTVIYLSDTSEEECDEE